MDKTDPNNPSVKDVEVENSSNQPQNSDENELSLKSEVKDTVVHDTKLEEEPPKILFKKPQIGVIIGPRKGKIIPKLSTSVTEKDINETSTSNNALDTKTSSDISSTSNSNINNDNEVPTQSPAEVLANKSAPIPYKEPNWAGYPKKSYQFEVLKSGKILEHYDLTSKSCHVFGRLPNCDVTLLHPTISRHHAVIQYRSEDTPENGAGFYVYDLGSTHGTFLNKNRIKPRMYVRLHVGHILKFGCSTRLYLLQGPSEDEEEESELTVTQIQTQRHNELLKRKMEKLKGEVGGDEEDEGISWGMGEDADEETDLSINPFAATTNEELYLDDPKKTLRGWFEREGHELEYDVQEKGVAQFLCQVELPIESARGGVVIAEAMVKGKKKEAVVQCALEACRILDRYGLLRQANHESKKRKIKNWEAEDYYDSDEDTFLDRTGSVEMKRSQRMKMSAPQQALTYNTLLEQHAAVVKELKEGETRLDEAIANRNAAKSSTLDEEDLDAFMQALKNPAPDKLVISQLKSSIVRLKSEESRLRQLVNLARPANLPELKPQAAETASTVGNSAAGKMAAILARSRKLAKMKHGTDKGKIGVETRREREVDGSDKEEEDDSSEVKDGAERREIRKEDVKKDVERREIRKEEVEEDVERREIRKEDVKKGAERREIRKEEVKKGVERRDMRKEEVKEGAEKRVMRKEEVEEDVDEVLESVVGVSDAEVRMDVEISEAERLENEEKEAEKRRKKNRKRTELRNMKAQKEMAAKWVAREDNYEDWTPPEGQSGDGKTSLNEKLGY